MNKVERQQQRNEMLWRRLVASTSKEYYSKLGKTNGGFVSNRFWYLKSFSKFPSSKWY